MKEAKGVRLELQMLNKLETDEWKEFTEKHMEELRKYQQEYLKLVKQLSELEMMITKAVEKSDARRKQSSQPSSDPKWR